MKTFKYIAMAGAVFATMFTACSDNPTTAGTAVEPNQDPIAYEDVSSSSIEKIFSSSSKEVSSSSRILESSSSKEILNPPELQSSSSTPSRNTSSSSDDSTSSVQPPVSQSSSSNMPVGRISSSSLNNDSNSPVQNDVVDVSLDGFIHRYGYTDLHFDENVLAYKLLRTHLACEEEGLCSATPSVYEEYLSEGLHRNVEREVAKDLFPMAGAQLQKFGEECPLYSLNVETTTYAGYVLTSISKDTLTVVDMDADYCDTGIRRVFGILFKYCGEISAAPVIVHQKRNETIASCRELGIFKEWINPGLL